MLLIQKINDLIKQASKDKDSTSRNILKLLSSEISREENSQKNKLLTEDEKQLIIRRLIKSNNQTLDCINDSSKTLEYDEEIKKLKKENDVLSKLLPDSLTIDQLKEFITNNKINIKDVSNEGQAIGMIMKELKKNNLRVDIDVLRALLKG